MANSGWLPPTTQAHPVVVRVARVIASIEALGEVSLLSARPGEVTDALRGLAHAETLLAAVTNRVLVHADQSGTAAEVGATDIGSWWAHETRQTRAAVKGRVKTARRLDGPRSATGAALAAGVVNPEQARVITQAVDTLESGPLEERIDPALVAEAEAHLIDLAGVHDAKALRILGKRVLDVIAPEIAPGNH